MKKTLLFLTLCLTGVLNSQAYLFNIQGKAAGTAATCNFTRIKCSGSGDCVTVYWSGGLKADINFQDDTHLYGVGLFEMPTRQADPECDVPNSDCSTWLLNVSSPGSPCPEGQPCN